MGAHLRLFHFMEVCIILWLDFNITTMYTAFVLYPTSSPRQCCSKVFCAWVRIVWKGLEENSALASISGCLSFSICLLENMRFVLGEGKGKKKTYRARCRCAFDSGAPLPSPICPGFGLTFFFCCVASSSAAGAADSSGTSALSSSSTAASASCISSRPPPICSFALRFCRRAWDFEYGEWLDSRRCRRASRFSCCFSFFLSGASALMGALMALSTATAWEDGEVNSVVHTESACPYRFACRAPDFDVLDRVILDCELALGELHGRVVAAYAFPAVLGLRGVKVKMARPTERRLTIFFAMRWVKIYYNT